MEKISGRFEVNRSVRGHIFYGPDLLAAPNFYSTEDVPAPDKVIHARFFTATGSEWFVAEYDAEANEVFCFAVMNGNTEFAEWGYSSLAELEGLLVVMVSGPVIVERDLQWTPRPFKDVVLP